MGARRILPVILIGLLSASPIQSVHADDIGFSEMFGFPHDRTSNLTISQQELQSLGCLISAIAIGTATIVFSSAAIIVTQGQGAATATTVAIPVLAAAMTAGCMFGSQSALAVSWIGRNSEALFGKVVNAIPAKPLGLNTLIPGRQD